MNESIYLILFSPGPPRVEANLPDQAGRHRRGRHRQPGDDVPMRLREAGQPGEYFDYFIYKRG